MFEGIEEDIQKYPVFMISKRNSLASEKAEEVLRKEIFTNDDMKILDIENHPLESCINVSGLTRSFKNIAITFNLKSIKSQQFTTLIIYPIIHTKTLLMIL